MAEYNKPHRNFNEQIALMKSRGLGCEDDRAAVQALKRIGYYRLSAYSYPFRRFDPDRPGKRCDEFIAGATFEQVVELCDFDSKLRAQMLVAAEIVEVALRVQVAYFLGKRERFGHLDRVHLDEGECAGRRGTHEKDVHTDWIDRYERRASDSQNEDFIRHFREKYDGQLPIWVAVEILEFGQLVRLYGMLDKQDKRRISDHFGVKGHNVLHKWLIRLNNVRNHCAHHDRIWNRIAVYGIPAVHEQQVPAALTHLSRLGDDDRKRIYTAAALSAHIVTLSKPETNWPRSFKTVVSKLPLRDGVVTEAVMGFPTGWKSFDIWNYEPKR
ncbi:Abi family protein [Antrihabitans sp. YC3-6]|uniref:Abi family protein n=1 Tax=Antrihabitans stalagmiti TaxID=2799499 RepID=A0A934NR99_9NOCA|nr:Abi family protein [Antrihabitans stalagmiti]MBJ8340014.1 Abi family protein [Antrihabitans stalagmiti]